MLNRAFFSLQSNWIPTAVALANLALNAVLDAAFYRLGVWGIPLSTSLVNLAGTAALLVLLRRRIGPIGFSAIAAQTGRVLAASAALAVVAFGVWRALDDALGRLARRRSSSRSASPSPRRGSCTSARAASPASASSTRCSRSAAPESQRAHRSLSSLVS